MERFKVTLREVAESDLKQIFEWRNRDDIRSVLFTQHQISWEEHVDFFERLSHRKDRKFLVAEEAQLGRVGVVNFYDLQPAFELGSWGFYIGQQETKGLGLPMGIAALDYAFGPLRLFKLCGEVMDFNERSINFHKKLGFREEGVFLQHMLVNQKRENVHRFGITRDEWNSVAREEAFKKL